MLLLTWLGDSTNEALTAMLQSRGYVANADGPGLEVHKASHSIDQVIRDLVDVASGESLSLETLLAGAQNLQREKWDWSLPEQLLFKTYASLRLNLDEVIAWAQSLKSESGG